MKDYLKKYGVLIVGLIIMAFGVAFSIKGALGTSPISSLPYVTSLMSGLTVGQTTIVLHCVLIALQILMLRRKYEIIQLMQLPVAFLFGFLTDFANNSVAFISCNNYVEQWICCIIGILLVGIGVSFEVTANVVTLAGEGFVLAACKVTPIPFARMKITFDTTLVIISVILSVIFLHSLQGVREGTLAAALCVGLVAKQVNKPMGSFMEKWLGKTECE